MPDALGSVSSDKGSDSDNSLIRDYLKLATEEGK